jgi:anti-anti-sigma factor
MSLDELLRDYDESHPQARIGTRRSKSGDLVLALSGDLEMKTSSDMAPVLESALLECPPRGRLVLDLSCVGYISSTGIGLLTTTMISSDKRSITLALLDIPPGIKNIMDTLGLLSFFNVEASID